MSINITITVNKDYWTNNFPEIRHRLTVNPKSSEDITRALNRAMRTILPAAMVLAEDEYKKETK